MKNIDRFNINEEQLRTVVAEGLSRGGDWCDLYFEDSCYNDLLLRDGEVSSGGHHLDFGCGIRVLKGEKTGYAYTERTDLQSLLGAARAASSIACVGSGDATPFRSCASTAPLPDCYRARLDWRDARAAQFVPFLKRLDAEIRRRDPRVIKVIAALSYCVSEIAMYNSLGELCCDSRPLGSVSVQTIFRQGSRTEDNNVSRSLRCGPEMIDDALLEDLVTRTLDGMDARFEAKRPKGGKMPVVMGAGASPL